MTKPRATASQVVQNKLVNRRPIRCAVYDRYISPFTGLPVILDDREQIIGFVHPGCCVRGMGTLVRAGARTQPSWSEKRALPAARL